MTTINCPKCKEPTSVDIAKAIDEHGEVFRCTHCGWQFRYTLK